MHTAKNSYIAADLLPPQAQYYRNVIDKRIVDASQGANIAAALDKLWH